MGNSSTTMQSRYQQHAHNQRTVLHSIVNSYYAGVARLQSKMGKVAFILLNALSISGYGIIILLNIADFKAWVLFAIGVIYGGARLFFYIVKSNQERRMRELDIKEKEIQVRAARKAR